MSEPSQFRHYQIVQDTDGNNVELVRDAQQVAVLSFDMQRLEYVHCHVLLEPPADRAAFENACKTLQKNGHPALARMIEFGEDEGNPFYITGNVDGEILRAYLLRQQDLPCWLAVMIACRALEAATAVCERGEFLNDSPLDSFRVVQAAPQNVQVFAADYRVIASGGSKKRALKTGFEKQARFLRTFLAEQGGGGPTQPDQPLPAADFSELLGGCLASAGTGAVTAMRDLLKALRKLAPDQSAGEIPAAHKPRALLAPLLASYQEVARGLVNLVRIQSQRLDMANPYGMRGTLTKTGRAVLIEQVPSVRIACSRVREVGEAALKITRKRDSSGLVTVALVNEAEDVVCLAEEVVEGISLADLLRERRSLDAQEAYLVLAGLDSALTQLESCPLPAGKLRLEDIFLLTGFAREDARSTKLLVSPLNEWPAFNIIVRAHPTLASMSGRGTDPAVLLPPAKSSPSTTWHAGWLAALCKFLLGIESPMGITSGQEGSARERETVARLLEDEIAKVAEAKPANRSDFLARYARIIQHYDLVKPVSESTPSGKRVETGGLKASAKPASGMKTAAAKKVTTHSPAVLTTGGATIDKAANIGFAELLFRNAGGDPSPPDTPDWARAAANAPPTLPEHLIPRDDAPPWLKAAVFIGGSMVLGAMCAHLSGDALWQRKKLTPAAAGNAGKTSVVAPAPAPPPQAPPVPKAIPVVDEIPQSDVERRGRGVSLTLPAGSSLREGLAEPETRRSTKP